MENKTSIAQLSLTLSRLHRYSTTPSLVNESVSDHSYLIALTAIDWLCQYPELLEHISREEILIRAILHDACESQSGDICSLFKRKIPNGEELFEAAETKVIEDICKDRPESFKKLLEMSVTFSTMSTPNEAFFKLLDIYCVLIKAHNELRLGNTYYERVYNEISELVDTYNKLFSEAVKSYIRDKFNEAHPEFINLDDDSKLDYLVKNNIYTSKESAELFDCVINFKDAQMKDARCFEEMMLILIHKEFYAQLNATSRYLKPAQVLHAAPTVYGGIL